MENAGVDGCCHQVIGCCDGVNVPSQMEVELKRTKGLFSFKVAFLSILPSITVPLYRVKFVLGLRGSMTLFQNMVLMSSCMFEAFEAFFISAKEQ